MRAGVGVPVDRHAIGRGGKAHNNVSGFTRNAHIPGIGENLQCVHIAARRRFTDQILPGTGTEDIGIATGSTQEPVVTRQTIDAVCDAGPGNRIVALGSK